MESVEQQVTAELVDIIKAGFIQGCETECARHWRGIIKDIDESRYVDTPKQAVQFMDEKTKTELLLKLAEMYGLNAEEKRLALYDLLSDLSFEMGRACE